MKKFIIALLFLTTQSSFASNEFCVAHFESGEEGAPVYNYKVLCNNEKPAYTKSKWCWTNSESCMAEVHTRLSVLMDAKGYSKVGKFKFSQSKQNDYGYTLFQKTNLIKDKKQKFCLALRGGNTGSPVRKAKLEISYLVDCGDKSLTNLRDIESGDSYEGISEHMKERGYSLAEKVIDSSGNGNKYSAKVVFKKE